MNSLWKRWLNFWFAAADPTTMSLVRIVTGLLILYVHLAYCFDLTSFFGKDAWITLPTIDRERRERPYTVLPFDRWEYDYKPKSAMLPDEIPRRQAVANWIRNLPLDQPATLRKKLRLVDSEGVLSGNGFSYYPATIQAAMPYCLTLGTDDEVRQNALKALRGEIPPGANENLHEEFKKMPPAELKTLTEDLDGFCSLLPKGTKPDEIRNREFVANFFYECDPGFRANLMRFIVHLSALTPAEREERIDYLSYWNVEKRYATGIGSPIFSIWFHISTREEMIAVHIAILIIMLMFTLGLFTRVTSILTWLCAVSYLHRNQQVLFGQDTMMNILLIYLMVAGGGGTLSLDRLIAKYRAVRHSLRRTGTIDARTKAFLDAPPPSVTSGFAQRMLQIHFCFIYMASGMSKLLGNNWWNTNAIWDTLLNPEFTMVHYTWYQDLLRAAFASKPVFAIAATAGAAMTFLTEIGLPFLVWTKMRPFAVILGCMFHAGIGIFMGLLVFSLMMMTMLLSYLPGTMIRGQLFGPPPTKRFGFRFDPKVDGQARAAALIAAFDATGAVDFSQAPGSATLTLPDGSTHSGPAAASQAMRSIPGVKWLRWVSFVWTDRRSLGGV